MNKELIKLIDQPESDRGKILMCLATKGPMKSFNVAASAGTDLKKTNAHLSDMFKDSSYVDMERYKESGVWVYNLVGLKCKMSESRKVKNQRERTERNEVKIPFNKWRKVFCLMDSCCG
jgi:hypothetical protein